MNYPVHPMVYHDLLQALKESPSIDCRSIYTWTLHRSTHLKVQDIRKDVWTAAGHCLVRFDDIREDDRLLAEIIPQQFRALNSQLTESTWQGGRSHWLDTYWSIIKGSTRFTRD